jgi:transposase
MAGMSQRYPQELKERAVRLVVESRDRYESEWAAIQSIAAKLGIGSTETLRKWVRRAEVDAGDRPGVTTQEAVEMRRLRAEVRELRRANEILRAGGCCTNRPARSVFSLAGGRGLGCRGLGGRVGGGSRPDARV